MHTKHYYEFHENSGFSLYIYMYNDELLKECDGRSNFADERCSTQFTEYHGIVRMSCMASHAGHMDKLLMLNMLRGTVAFENIY